MADITMCTGEECDRKDRCYRYTAPVNKYRQSYFNYPPIVKKMDGYSCEYFWNNEEKKDDK